MAGTHAWPADGNRWRLHASLVRRVIAATPPPSACGATLGPGGTRPRAPHSAPGSRSPRRRCPSRFHWWRDGAVHRPVAPTRAGYRLHTDRSSVALLAAVRRLVQAEFG